MTSLSSSSPPSLPCDAETLAEADIASVHAAFDSGALSAERLVDLYLERIETVDNAGPALRSILTLNPAAQAEAAQRDAARRAGTPAGLLHGIPVLLKDNIETAGIRTTAGAMLLAEHRPQQDAFLVSRLRAAGAVILGKTNLHEFASSGETVSSLGGQTRNPYDLTRTPGGSSGGTGAAIAANLGLAGIGTDTINSVRSPASANALVGLRPTIGLVSRSGIIPYGLTQDTAGPMTRTVADTARLLDVIAAPDPADPATLDMLRKQPPSYTAFLDADGLRGARIGVLASLFGTDVAHRETSGAIRRAAEVMRERGAMLFELDDVFDCATILEETSVHHHEVVRDLADYLGGLSNPAVRDWSGLTASSAIHPQVAALFRRISDLRIDSDDYRARMASRSALQEQLLGLISRHRLDALLFPHQKRLVVPIGESQVERNGVLAGITGFPAITVPAGFSAPSRSAPIGVPIGLELLGSPYSEATLIRLAFAYEQATHHRQPPKLLK